MNQDEELEKEIKEQERQSDPEYQKDIWIHFSNPFSTGFWMGIGFFAAGFAILFIFLILFGGAFTSLIESIGVF